MADLIPFTHEPEIVGEQPAGFARVLALTNPFTMEREDRLVPAGATLQEIVDGLALRSWKSARVELDGVEIPIDEWATTRTRKDSIVVARAIPRQSGGGGNKGWIGIVLGVVLIIVGIILAFTPVGAGSPFLTSLGVGLIVGGIGYAISGVLALVLPPPQLDKLKSGAGNDAPVFSITGARNQLNPYGVVPRILGRHRVFPPEVRS
jgi:hypothetical protein